MLFDRSGSMFSGASIENKKLESDIFINTPNIGMGHTYTLVQHDIRIMNLVVKQKNPFFPNQQIKTPGENIQHEIKTAE